MKKWEQSKELEIKLQSGQGFKHRRDNMTFKFQLTKQADLATERERQLTTARANKTTDLTNGRAAN